MGSSCFTPGGASLSFVTPSATLSICIPTYNRARFIGELLHSIISQAPQDGRVEICVSDNASMDHTFQVVEAYQKKFPFISYEKQSENIGFDRNLLKSVALAKGEFIWLMGDDDRVVPGALAEVIRFVTETSHLSGISLPYVRYDRSMTRHIPGVLTRVFEQNMVSADIRKNIKNYYPSLGYLSTLVILRHHWNSIVEKNKASLQLYCHAYVHVFIVLSIWKTFTSDVWGYLAIPCVENRGGNDTHFGQDIFRRVMLDLESLGFIEGSVLKGDLSRVARREFIRFLLIEHILRIKLNKLSLMQLCSVMRICLKLYWTIPLFWGRVFFLFFIPSSFVFGARWIYQKTLKPLRFRQMK